MPADLRQQEAWENRHRVMAWASGTAHHGPRGNAQFYRAKYAALARCLRTSGLQLTGKSVYDAAGGAGIFVPFFLRHGASSVVVADFSQTAVDRVRQNFGHLPNVEGRLSDMSVPEPDWPRRFDFVFLMEAVFLLDSDEALAATIANLAGRLNPGGHIILSDLFPNERLTPHRYVTRRPRAMFEQLLNAAGVDVVAYVPQGAVLFNRRVFGPVQGVVEGLGLLYWLDRAAQALGMKPPADVALQYLVGRKNP